MVNLCIAFSLVVMSAFFRREKAFSYIIVFFLFLLAANNIYTPDRDAYRIYYHTINHVSFSNVTEIGFQGIIIVSKFFNLSLVGFFHVYYSVTFILFLLILRNISNCPAFVSGLYLLFPYVLDVDQMRSLLGYLIVLFCLSFQIKKNKFDLKWYILACIIASLFQQSSLIFLIYCLCILDTKQIIKFTGALAALLLIGRNLILFVSSKIPTLNSSRIERYLSSENNKSNLYIYILFFVGLICFTIYIIRKFNNMIDDKNAELFLKLNIISLALVTLILASPHFERLLRPIVLLDYIYLTNHLSKKFHYFYQLVIVSFLVIFSFGRFLTYVYGNGWNSYIEPIFYRGFNSLSLLK